MRSTYATVTVAFCVAGCGGRIVSIGSDGGTVAPASATCTESDCASSVVVLATGDIGFAAPVLGELFVGGGYVYVGTKGAIARVPVSGGSLETFTSTSDQVATILADDHDVYWTVLPNKNSSAIFRLSQTGGAPTSLGAPPVDTPAIFLDRTTLYWKNDTVMLNALPLTEGSATTMPFSRDALSPMVLVDGHMLRADCTGIDVPSTGTVVAGYGMVADSSHCYELHGDCGQPWACGDVVSIPMGGGLETVRVKASSPSSQEFVTARMMIDELGFYLLKYDDRPHDAMPTVLLRVPFDGGSPVRLTDDAYVVAYAVTANRIYWLTGSNDLKSMPKYKP